jgi:hypothetical protein
LVLHLVERHGSGDLDPESADAGRRIGDSLADQQAHERPEEDHACVPHRIGRQLGSEPA